MKPKIINRTILILSLVSLFTDISTEMLYPVLPVYLKSIGFSIVLIGLLEGFTEAVTGYSKGYFGFLSDQSGKRLPYIRIGYFMSAISKPMIAFFTFPWWIFGSRALDRLGKGIRTSARDAMLSDQATPENKAKVFGFHRSMDTLGATIGPLLALIFLYFYPGHLKTMFFIALVPGLFAVFITFLVQDQPRETTSKARSYSIFQFFKYWGVSTSKYKLLIIGFLAFTFFNSSNVFMLLMVKERGWSEQNVIQAYIFYNFCYALLSYPLGHLADKIGLRITFMFGLVIFAVVYAGMGFSESLVGFFILFFLYGLYSAATEGISKAWLSNCAGRENTATALGLFGALNSIMAVISSTIAGILWTSFGPQVTFIFSAIGACLVLIYFLVVLRGEK